MRHTDRIFKLGTRDSLLAKAQSRIVAKALAQKNPGLEVELVPLSTRGDVNRTIPLSNVRDPDFFSAELDTALTNARVDLCVHSLKDLGQTRPEGIVQAAIPERENPRDVVVFRPNVVERLESGQPLRIGSSSERRQTNVSQFLHEALPHVGIAPDLKFLPLRGPVEERLARIRKSANQTDALDGVILAIAGLSRLWGDAASHQIIKPLLADVRWMVLPLSRCPAAPGQGALAVECREDDAQALELVRSIHDPQTAGLVQSEFEALSAVPATARGGCGATAVAQERLGTLVYIRNANTADEQLIWRKPPRPTDVRAWDGGRLKRYLRRLPLAVEQPLPDASAIFVAHWHALTNVGSMPPGTRIWTSGVSSWRALARRGLWVEGCADNLGFANILATLECRVLGLPALERWIILTHRDARSSWRKTGVGRVHATYALAPLSPLEDAIDLHREISGSTHFFWGSLDQYRRVKKWVPVGAHHACGAGKTARALGDTGLNSVQSFPSRKEWRAWLS